MGAWVLINEHWYNPAPQLEPVAGVILEMPGLADTLTQLQESVLGVEVVGLARQQELER
jgi:hypothetical protein